MKWFQIIPKCLWIGIFPKCLWIGKFFFYQFWLVAGKSWLNVSVFVAELKIKICHGLKKLFFMPSSDLHKSLTFTRWFKTFLVHHLNRDSINFDCLILKLFSVPIAQRSNSVKNHFLASFSWRDQWDLNFLPFIISLFTQNLGGEKLKPRSSFIMKLFWRNNYLQKKFISCEIYLTLILKIVSLSNIRQGLSTFYH